MNRSPFHWKTLDLDAPTAKSNKTKHRQQKSSTINSSELEEMIIDRLNGRETKSIFFLKANL